jgi:hypothetical protein
MKIFDAMIAGDKLNVKTLEEAVHISLGSGFLPIPSFVFG